MGENEPSTAEKPLNVDRGSFSQNLDINLTEKKVGTYQE